MKILSACDYPSTGKLARLGTCALAISAGLYLAAGPAAKAQGTGLQMVAVDVEGGAATLFVTPEGKSLLIDTGYASNRGTTDGKSSAMRIVSAAHALGLRRIDYVLVTHYHSDHAGGVPDLVKEIPTGTFIDHGVNREVAGTVSPFTQQAARRPQAGGPAGGRGGNLGNLLPTSQYYENYLKAIAGHKRIIAKPGLTVNIGSMKLTIVSSDGVAISHPLAGAGKTDPECSSMQDVEETSGEEDTRSIASVITFGKARIAAFGDMTWNREKDLFCPNDKVGKVDVYLASHHSASGSGSPAMVNALQPIVAILGNSASKGDDEPSVKIMQESPRIKALWRLHKSRQHPQLDGDERLIANPSIEQGVDGDYNIRLRIQENGDTTVINDRNGYNQTYKAS